VRGPLCDLAGNRAGDNLKSDPSCFNLLSYSHWILNFYLFIFIFFFVTSVMIRL
jgi:hypothetical protein